jgi:hypothetical protein
MAVPNLDESVVVLPIPPRYWWLKRIMIAVGVLLILLLALRLWWGWEAHRRFQAELDKLIAAGEPIFPEDFNPKEPIPDEQNAAILYRRAGALISLNDDDTMFVGDMWANAPWTGEEFHRVRRIAEAHSESLTLLRDAREFPQTDWGTRFRTPVWNELDNLSFWDQRTLMKLASIRAECAHRDKDDVEAVRVLLDMVAHADAVDDDPWLISHLVAIAGYGVVTNRVESVAPALSIESGSSRESGATPASRNLVQKLVTVLLDERPVQQGLARCTKSERMFVIDNVKVMTDRMMERDDLISETVSGFVPWWKRAFNWPFSPRLFPDGVYIVRTANELVDAAGAADWPMAKTCFTERKEDVTAFEAWLRPMSSSLWGGWERFTYLHFQMLAVRRMAATALAIRLYEVDHGRRPESLDELVPDYLSAVPLDPLAEGNRPIGYLPNAEHAILYSVGENGIGNGGRYEIDDYGNVDRRKLDWPFFLDGPPEAPAPSDDDSEPDHDEVD